LSNDLDCSRSGVHVTPARLAASSFPRPPLARHGAAAPAALASRPPATREPPAARPRTW
jgi:hypothetical protein